MITKMNDTNTYQKPVNNTENFIGHDTLTAKIYSRIGAGRPQSVSIVGDYKIGKTSLMNFLTAADTKKKYLDNPGAYIYVSFSVSENKITTLDRFIEILVNALSQKANIPVDDSIGYYDWIKKVAETLTSKNIKIIIFLDDFNMITQNENFPLEFFSFMRSIANNYNVAYVTTSYHDLQKLCVSKDVEESPFFNIFTNMTLRAISDENARDLIKREIYDISDDQIKLLIKYAGRFPYQLKIACSTLKKLSASDANGNTEETFRNAFYDSIKGYFDTLFSRFDMEHQKILKRFMATGKVPDQLHFLFNDLERKDYAYKNGKKAGLYSPVFERFIAQKFDLPLPGQKSGTSFFRKILNLFKS